MYSAYRYFILESKQLPIFPQTESKPKSKEEWFLQTMKSIENLVKFEFISDEHRYLIYFKRNIGDEYFVIHLAKEVYFNHPLEGEREINEMLDKQYPLINILFDIKHQLVLIQNKTTVFRNINTSKEKLELFFEQQLKEQNIIVSLSSITNEEGFWHEVGELDLIYSLDLTLKAPNFFKGRFEAEEFVKETYEDYNFSTLKIGFKSAIGRLQLLKQNLQGYIQLISAGGGDYILKGLKKGKEFTFKSSSKSVKVDLPSNIEVLSNNDIKQEFASIAGTEIANESIEEQSLLDAESTVKNKQIQGELFANTNSQIDSQLTKKTKKKNVENNKNNS